MVLIIFLIFLIKDCRKKLVVWGNLLEEEVQVERYQDLLYQQEILEEIKQKIKKK